MEELIQHYSFLTHALVFGAGPVIIWIIRRIYEAIKAYQRDCLSDVVAIQKVKDGISAEIESRLKNVIKELSGEVLDAVKEQDKLRKLLADCFAETTMLKMREANLTKSLDVIKTGDTKNAPI